MKGSKRNFKDEMHTLLKERNDINKRICSIAQDNLQEQIQEAVDTFRFDEPTLKRIYLTLFDEMDNGNINVIDQEAILAAWKPHKKPLLFVKNKYTSETIKMCAADACFYDLNHDRINEWTHSYYNAANPKQFVYCNVCINNLDEDDLEEIIEAERDELLPILETQLKEYA